MGWKSTESISFPALMFFLLLICVSKHLLENFKVLEEWKEKGQTDEYAGANRSVRVGGRWMDGGEDGCKSR